MTVTNFKMSAEVVRLQFIMAEVIESNPNMKFVSKDNKGQVIFEFIGSNNEKHDMRCIINKITDVIGARVKVTIHEVGHKDPSFNFTMGTFDDIEINVAKYLMDAAPAQILYKMTR